MSGTALIVSIAKRVLAGMKEHNIPVTAAGIAFFGMLAIVPTLIATISIYGMVADADELVSQIESATENLPESSADFINGQASSIANTSGGSLGRAAVFGLLLALWSASGAVKHVIVSINQIYGFPEHRKFAQLRGLAVGFLVGSIVFVAIASFAIGVLPVLLDQTGLGGSLQVLLGLATLPLVGLVMVAGLTILYRFAPARRPLNGRWWTWGGIVAMLIFILGSLGFQIYAGSRFNSSIETYGVFAAIIMLLLWLLITSYAVLIGALVNSELEKRGRY